MINIFRKIKIARKHLEYYSPLRKYFFPSYKYLFTPPQLCLMCQYLEETRNLEGAIAEIGCATGWTTVFLNKYLAAQGIDKTYFTIDTFSGFVKEDIEHEVKYRGKSKINYRKYFTINSKKWFDYTISKNKLSNVICIQADINKFNISTMNKISFCLIDVDLYKPVKESLKGIYDILVPGGLIVVDDCNPVNVRWDGADQAYKEFCDENNISPNVLHQKLGVIRKNI